MCSGVEGVIQAYAVSEDRAREFGYLYRHMDWVVRGVRKR